MNRKNFRERRKKFIMCFGAFVIVACFSLSIAYAALSETLKISGSAGVQAADWNVYLKPLNSSDNDKVVSYTIPSVSGTGLSDYSVTFSEPGGWIEFTYQIINDSNYNAILDSVVNSTPVCTSDTGNEEDEKNVCDNIETFVYWGGYRYSYTDSIKIGDVISYDEYLCSVGQTASWRSGVLSLRIYYDATAETLPSSNVTISNLNHEFILSITDQKCVYDSSLSPFA